MTPRLCLVAVLLAAAATLPARAAAPIALHARNTGELAELCSANPREAAADARINFCEGFAQGVVDMELERAGDKKPFCFPPQMRRRETLVEFSHWVRAAPDHANMPAARGLVRFLSERFPCH